MNWIHEEGDFDAIRTWMGSQLSCFSVGVMWSVGPGLSRPILKKPRFFRFLKKKLKS